MAFQFSQLEEKILNFWEKRKIFERSVLRKGLRGDFIFFEGPPTANAPPGLHHVLARVFKDIVCRFKTMVGFRVERKAGWDTHGLPVELQIEKKLGLKNKKEIEKFGIGKFNQECKKSVFDYKTFWEDLTKKIGYWLDLKNAYITYETSYIESLWWILKKFWEKNLLYEDFKVVPYCSRCGTGLSSHEVAQNYKNVREKAVFVKFKIKEGKFKDDFFLVWTTTPWTLFANVALAVNPEFVYVRIKKDNENFILAKERARVIFSSDEKIIDEFNGENLLGIKYLPPFPFENKEGQRIYEVLPADFVNLQEGTGIVHIAPAFGAEDMDLIKKENEKAEEKKLKKFPIIVNVNEEGKFKDGKWQGVFVKEADEGIIDQLKKIGLLFKEEFYEHDYPFCWRCNTPLIYYAKTSWFIRVTKFKNELLKNNQKIRWLPDYLKEGRFGEWLKEVKDWALSRDRYWGTPLPVWQCEKCKKREIVGSLKELYSRPFSKNRYYILRHGEAMSNIKNVVSCWPEKDRYPLTKKGEKQIEKAVRALKKEKIDIIFSSDILRTKQTAEILARELKVPLFFAPELREWNVGIFNGKSPALAWGSFFKKEKNLEKWVKMAPPEGESPLMLQKRMYHFLKECEKKYKGKNILLVSHEFPLTSLEKTLEGMEMKEILKWSFKNDKKKIKKGEWRKIDFKMLPFDDEMKINLHRPYIDEVSWYCECGGRMKRLEPVIDCWFDSGSMPFAQCHWPFEQKLKKEKKLSPPKSFPADYICEGIDQTRGWFYTLLAVSTLLGFGFPYKNVLTVGHILDEKGEKMSKSKGNIVNPWMLIEKYGADSLRWYLFTISQPWESKRFKEDDLQKIFRKFFLILWNAFQFLELYGRWKVSKKEPKREDVLDRWIISRLASLAESVKKKMDDFKVMESALEIEKFVLDDLSGWYIRRVKERIQSEREQKQVSQVLFFVFLNLSKILAPFCPFLAEYFYQKVLKKNFRGNFSVHLEYFPEGLKKFKDEKLEKEMAYIRQLISLILAKRKEVKIKVRQPLSELRLKKKIVSKDLVDLISKEVNVKKIVFDEKLKSDFELNTLITPELRREGILRDLTREIQDLRKKKNFLPKDRVVLTIFASKEFCDFLKKSRKYFSERTKIKKIHFLTNQNQAENMEKIVVIDNEKIFFSLKRDKK